MSRPENPVQLAVIGAAHGIRGEVRVKPYTEDPLAIGDYGLLYDKQGKSYEVLDVRNAKTVVIVRFRGINDRNAAEALNGTELFIDRSQLSEDLDDDEFYYADLIGLQAYDKQGNNHGRVHALFDFGGGDLIELRLTGRKPMLIPFTEAAVTEIDLTNGKIIVDPYAAGLIADQDDDYPDDGYDDERDREA